MPPGEERVERGGRGLVDLNRGRIGAGDVAVGDRPGGVDGLVRVDGGWTGQPDHRETNRPMETSHPSTHARADSGRLSRSVTEGSHLDPASGSSAGPIGDGDGDSDSDRGDSVESVSVILRVPVWRSSRPGLEKRQCGGILRWPRAITGQARLSPRRPRARKEGEPGRGPPGCTDERGRLPFCMFGQPASSNRRSGHGTGRAPVVGGPESHTKSQRNDKSSASISSTASSLSSCACPIRRARRWSGWPLLSDSR